MTSLLVATVVTSHQLWSFCSTQIEIVGGKGETSPVILGPWQVLVSSR
jgi:hypothetical protein